MNLRLRLKTNRPKTSRPKRQQSNPSAPKALLSAWLCAAALLAGLPWMLGASLVPKSPDKRRKMVEAMSTAERKRLNLNLAAYRLLPSAEKQRLHQLEAVAASNTAFTKVMEDYEAWLDTLTPWERQTLRQEADPVRRIKLVKDIREQQRQKQEAARQEQERLESEWEDALNRNLSRMMGPRNPQQLRLRGDMLERMMKVLQESLPPGAISTGKLSDMRKSKRYITVLTAALKDGRKRNDFSRQPLTREVLEKMINKIDNEKIRQTQLEVVNSATGSRRLVSMLSRAIFQMRWAEARRFRPSRRQIPRLMEKVGARQRAEFERIKKGNPRAAFRFLFMAKEETDFTQDTLELKKLLAPLRLSGLRGR